MSAVTLFLRVGMGKQQNRAAWPTDASKMSRYYYTKHSKFSENQKHSNGLLFYKKMSSPQSSSQAGLESVTSDKDAESSSLRNSKLLT